MGVLASDEKLSEKNTADEVTILPVDWKPTARQCAQTAVVKYFAREGREKEAAEINKVLLFPPQIATVALCASCATEPRFHSSSFCAGCIGRQMQVNCPEPVVIELTPIDMLKAWLFVGLLIFVLLFFGFNGGN